MTKPENKNLIVEMHEEMHKKLKISAVEKNISLRKLVLQILANHLLSEENINADKCIK